jgi:6-pyruvoyltetrahydropterin/6-carboxytetrahydropterin synthase
MIIAERYHDISVGHRVYGHESKCVHLHGHNYRITFTINGELDALGRVLDFGIIKSHLCNWLEEHWDHKFLLWEKDPMRHIFSYNPDQYLGGISDNDAEQLFKEAQGSIVLVPFNPTAENMAEYLLNVIGPQQLEGTGAEVVSVRVEETRKCSAIAFISPVDKTV